MPSVYLLILKTQYKNYRELESAQKIVDTLLNIYDKEIASFRNSEKNIILSQKSSKQELMRYEPFLNTDRREPTIIEYATPLCSPSGHFNFQATKNKLIAFKTNSFKKLRSLYQKKAI